MNCWMQCRKFAYFQHQSQGDDKLTGMSAAGDRLRGARHKGGMTFT